MQPSTRSFHFFGPLLAVLAIALSASNLTGCAAPALALVAPGYFALNHLPGDAKVELTDAGKGAQAPFDNVQSVLTNNEYAKKFLQEESGLFSRVNLTKDAPVNETAAYKMAASGGYDAFVFVDTNGASRAGNMLIQKVSYGTANVTIISKKGVVVYKQTARLIAGAATRVDMNERQIAEVLAKAIVDDIKVSKGQPIQAAATPKEGGFMSKVKSLFD